MLMLMLVIAVVAANGDAADVVAAREAELGTVSSEHHRPRSSAARSTISPPSSPHHRRLVLHVVAATKAGHSRSGRYREAADGSALTPFRSVTAARDALRQRQQPLPPGGATVLLHGGHHQPFALEAVDSGRPGAPIVYAAAPGENAVVSGALALPPAAFKAWGSAGVLRAELGPLGISKAMLGGMQFPTAEGSMSFGSCQHDKAELFWGGEAQTLARYPNKAPDGTWKFLHAFEAGKFGPGPAGGGTTDGGTWFLMKQGENASNKIQSWTTGPDKGRSWLHGYWEFDWADSYRKLDSVTAITVPGPPPPPFPPPGHPPAPPCSSTPQKCNPQYHPACSNSTWCTSDHRPGQCDPGKCTRRTSCPACPQVSHYINVSFVPDGGDVSAGLQIVKRNARFYGVNLLSELDAAGEYYIDEEQLVLYFLPPDKIDAKPLLLSVNASAVVSLGRSTQHVHLQNLEVGFGRGIGISASGVGHVLIHNCTVHGLGTSGVSLDGTDSAIIDSEVFHTGCAGVHASGGLSRPLVPGNISVRGNYVHHIAQWKRTYQAAISFGGSGNTYSDNTVGFAPHTCMTGGGVNLSFTGNLFDTCCLESSDVGAFCEQHTIPSGASPFYIKSACQFARCRLASSLLLSFSLTLCATVVDVCGQQGRAFWAGRGGLVRNNTFKNIRNQDGTGVQGPSVQALYLDDQVSAATVLRYLTWIL
jgi:hypothetical protein